MNKKGFTLIELLAVLVIIGILLGIAVSSVSIYMGRGKKEYYKAVESSLKASGQEYVSDYRSLLPREIGNTTVITVEELVKNNYIDEIVDEKKEACTGNVTIEKIDKNKYEYYVCLQCGDKYSSEEKNCELVGDNNKTKNFEITLNGNVETVVKQCDDLSLPSATVYQILDGERSIINNNLQPSPNSIDTTILGQTSVKWIYRYKSINKSIRVEDIVKPITPTVTLTYLNGTEYKGSNSTGSKNITNQDLNMLVVSKDYACKEKYPTLEGSGLSYIEYKTTTDNSWTKISTVKNKTNTVLSKTVFGEVTLRVVDKYENKSEEIKFEAYVDKKAPGKTTVTYLGGSSTHKFKNNYKLELKATDDIEVAYYEVDWDNDNVVDETTDSIYVPIHGFSYCKVRFRAVDIAGNRGPWSDTQEIHMDTESPSQTEVNLNGYTSGNWTNGDVKQTYTATDDLSGVASYEYSYDKVKIVGTTTKEWTLNTDGEYTLYARCVDVAGNRGKWSNVYYIKRDTKEPECTLKVSNTPKVLNGYYIDTVEIDFESKTDDRSQLKSATIDMPTLTTSSTKEGTIVTGTVIDNANNSNTCTIPVKIDVTKPTITAKSSPLGLGTGDYTFTDNLNVSYGPLGGSVVCDPASSKKTGSYNVTCTATGNNGKTNSVTFTAKHSYEATGTPYTYNCNPYTCKYSCGQDCGQSCTCSNYGWCGGELCCTETDCHDYCNTKYCEKTCYETCTGTKYSCPDGGTLSGTTCNY